MGTSGTWGSALFNFPLSQHRLLRVGMLSFCWTWIYCYPNIVSIPECKSCCGTKWNRPTNNQKRSQNKDTNKKQTKMKCQFWALCLDQCCYFVLTMLVGLSSQWQGYFTWNSHGSVLAVNGRRAEVQKTYLALKPWLYDAIWRCTSVPLDSW